MIQRSLLLLALSVAAPVVPEVVGPDPIAAQSTKAKSPPRSGARPKAKTGNGSGTANAKPARPARPAPEWPVKGPAPLPGSILPARRIVAYYGNPRSTRMGILGEVRPEEMLRRLDREVAAWTKADTTTPAIPALHLIAVVAQGSPGADGMWRARMGDSLIAEVAEWAQRRNALLFLDIQVGKSNLRSELPRLAHWFAKPNVHLGIDPEFSMKSGHAPGKRIGTMDASDVNYASEFLQELVTKHDLPPKVLVVHRFTRAMLTNYRNIRLDPRVQVVVQMDGWGNAELKRGSYVNFVYSEPVQFTGFKIFYKNDVRKKGWVLMGPADVLALNPKPLYIQYQ
ncbi:MAG: hypothetical protein IT361_18585 [Gemmatimonadaceae bacterium]|nr:hypothetical protein [Gemmatimonadaceae bacterium]